MTQDRNDYMREYQSRPESKAYKKEYREKNREKLREYARAQSKKWRAEHPGEDRKAWDKWNKKHPEMKIIHAIKVRAKRIGIPFSLKPEDIVFPELCPIFGIPMNYKDPKSPGYPNVDRIIPNKGYVSGNVKVISRKANQVKSCGSAEEHQMIANYIKENAPKDGTEFV